MIPTSRYRHVRTTMACALLGTSLVACESLTEAPQRQPLGAELTGGAVQPDSVATTGKGTFSATLRALSRQVAMEYSLTFSGLVGNATAVHLHGPASADNVGTLLADLAALPAGSSGTATLGGTSGSAQGTLELGAGISPAVTGDSLHVLLDAGLVYVDIHTSTRPDGEIRGQIRKQ